MRTGYALSALALALTASASSTTFVLKDKYIGYDFYSGFQWETFDDPTHGRVNYVDRQTGLAENLTFGTPSAGSRSASPRVSPAPCADTRSTPTPTWPRTQRATARS